MTQQQHPGTSQRPGQMTAVMRAVAANAGPKVLRIGVVQAGRVAEERIIKQRVHVTVGASEKNMFVVSSQNLPATFRLFELVGNDYHLNFLDGMTGRIALPTGISDLSMLKGQAKRSAQGAYQVRLTEDSRGKVVIGDTTFLFQFVAPPPIQPKPQLPVAVLRGASAIDWNTTIIAALSFLCHFMALGAIYSDWLDPVIDDEVNVAGLIDSLKSLPPPQALERIDQTRDVHFVVDDRIEPVGVDGAERHEMTQERQRRDDGGVPVDSARAAQHRDGQLRLRLNGRRRHELKQERGVADHDLATRVFGEPN